MSQAKGPPSMHASSRQWTGLAQEWHLCVKVNYPAGPREVTASLTEPPAKLDSRDDRLRRIRTGRLSRRWTRGTAWCRPEARTPRGTRIARAQRLGEDDAA